MSLKEFCEERGISVTERQSQILTLRDQGYSYREVAKELGIAPSTAAEHGKNIETKAALEGYAPNHEMTRATAPGFGIKRVSTLRDGQWVIQEPNAETKKQMLEGFVKGLCADIKPAKPVKPSKRAKYSKDLMPSIFIGDAHIGMRAFGVETKHHDFDTKIATEQLKEAFRYLTDKAEPAENSLFVDVGDAIHANTQHGTTVSGTPLDVDTRHYSVMKATAECMAYGINLQLQKHNNVTVVVARGNHNSDAAGAAQQ